ncbi:hypothetical protein L484_010424 [Morus notabilis]|uniref:Uncharacterized protein n=1 Tax=Morus notabilis TaxID=981085 RepID=W9QR61_9ROSA|nr:hypothetical protein L484_010424 [Morus notabilis]
MAEGFIQCNSNSGGKEPEDVGNDYFNDLQWMSFFQEMRREENGIVLRYKMHDVIHDLAQSVIGSDYLSGSGLRILKGWIGDLLHLKYLDLSHARIKKLPREIEGLVSLETLNLFHCYDLIELPDLRKMNRLRHLNNDDCSSLTQMLSNKKAVSSDILSSHITQLQTLPSFVVGDLNDFYYLKSLQLRGSLKVTHLENAAGQEFRSQFARIESLGLYWGTDEGCPNMNPEEECVCFQYQGRQKTSSSRKSRRKIPDPFQAELLLDNFKPADSL